MFPGLQVNHIVDVNFGGLQDLVDAIGCVYTDVDHRYYNNTALAPTTRASTSSPATRSCAGPAALQFVRFRHTDSDLVRNARQQDFIRWAKDQYGVANLLSNRDKLLRIFGAHTQTDHNLHTTDGLINLFDLVRLLGRSHDQADQVPGRSSCPCTRHRPVLRRRRPLTRPRRAAFRALHGARRHGDALRPSRPSLNGKRHKHLAAIRHGRPDRRCRRRQAQPGGPDAGSGCRSTTRG